MNDPLDAAAVTDQLTSRWLGQTCIYFPEIGSTNDWLKAEIGRGSAAEPPNGALVITDYQNRGRGRLTRRWEAPPRSSLLMSFLFRPNWPGEQINWLMMIGCLAAAEAIMSVTNVEIGLKWPNDLVVGQPGSWRKLGGLLLEADFSPQGMLATAVLGMGLNVNIAAADLPTAVTPPTSLLIETGQPVNRLTLLHALIHRLESHYDAACLGRSPYPAWRARLINLGQPAQLTDFATGQTITGLAVDVNDWGHLIIEDSDGRRHTITAGDVTLAHHH